MSADNTALEQRVAHLEWVVVQLAEAMQAYGYQAADLSERLVAGLDELNEKLKQR